MGKVDLVRFESADALAQAAAREWLDALQPTEPHYAAFSGGRIAEKFFDAITSEVRERQSSLAQVHFFWADERCVPPDDPESNYRSMHTRLLAPLRVPEAQVHRIRGEVDPALAAREASEAFAGIVRPVLNYVFLGIGEDGHIASIFPGDPIEELPSEHYRPIFAAPKPPPRRVTLAMHAMVAARQAWVLASGAGKEEALGKALSGSPGIPLARLLERRAVTRIFTNVFPK